MARLVRTLRANDVPITLGLPSTRRTSRAVACAAVRRVIGRPAAA
jgi:archaeosine-15-forming tRNA-guanine transglycosylase